MQRGKENWTNLLAHMGFLLQCLLLLGIQALGRGDFSSCGAWNELSLGMWDLPGLEIQPVSLALQGGFLTSGPLGKLLK